MKISSKKGLEELLRRYKNAGASDEWLLTIEACINEDLAMDEIDYENTPIELKNLWVGLK